jgi:uncharacterized protein YndB with AHSA1/START domain
MRREAKHMIDDGLRVDIAIEAPPERVWEAWADPVRLARWFVDQARGRIGESDSVTWIWEEFGLEVEHEVVEVEPGRRFELRARGPGGVRATEVVLVGEGSGTTRVRVMETGFGDMPAEGIESGWQMALTALKVYVEEYYDRGSRTVLVMAQTGAGPDAVRAMHRTEQGLARWLGSGGPFPGVGGEVALVHEDGLRVTGRVLWHSATETSLRWREIEGVLELKQFPGPGGRMVALRACSWAPEGANDPSTIRTRLSRALDRLVAALA